MALVTGKMVFIHVPRTGGHFFRDVIDELDIPHFECGDDSLPNIVQFHQAASEVPEEVRRDRYVFGFVRHPISWLVSRWWWQYEHQGRDVLWGRYAKEVVQNEPDLPSKEMFRLLDGVDHIYKYEDLPLAVISALTRSDYDVPAEVVKKLPSMPRKFARPEGARAMPWTTEMQDAVMDANKELCERFGYV